MAGKARRFNSYDVDVRNERRIAESFGLARQSQSGYTSSFSASPLSPVTTQRNIAIDVSSDGLGNHIATQTLNMSDNDISSIDNLFINTSATSDGSIQGHANGILYVSTVTNATADKSHFFYTHGVESTDVRFAITDDAVVPYEDVLPDTHNTVDLGSTTNRFKKLWLQDELNSNGNITIGGTALFGSTVTVSDNFLCGTVGIDYSEGMIEPSTGVIGFATSDGDVNIGSEGTVQLPYLSDGTLNPTSNELDGWFGNKVGCIGIQYYSGAGSNHRIWVKSDGGWVKNFLT